MAKAKLSICEVIWSADKYKLFPCTTVYI